MNVVSIINILFTCYFWLLIIRIIGSWFPSFNNSQFMHFVAFYTEPYLQLFRKVIPPVGMLDFSVIIAFIVLRIIQSFVVYFLARVIGT